MWSCLFAAVALAEDAPVEDAPEVDVRGVVDVGMYDVLWSPGLSTSEFLDDASPVGDLGVSYAGLGFDAQSAEAGAHLDVGLYPFTGDVWAGSALRVPRAEVTLRAPNARVPYSLDIGILRAPRGFDTYEPHRNWLASTGVVYHTSPWAHTGVRLNVPWRPRSTTQVGLSTNAAYGTFSDSPAPGLFLAHHLATTAGARLQVAVAVQRETSEGLSYYVDLTAEAPLAERWTLRAAVDQGRNLATMPWFAAELEARVQASRRAFLTARADVLHVDDFTTTWDVGRATAGYTLGFGEHAMVRAEVAGESSGYNLFNPVNDVETYQQMSARLNALAWF